MENFAASITQGRGHPAGEPLVDRSQTGATTPEATATDQPEVNLVDVIGRKFGAIPAEWIASHISQLYAEAGWPVQHACYEALLRRYRSSKTESLKVCVRPKGTRWGAYAVRRGRNDRRPYRIWLGQLSPLRASCECPDYQRNSLGLCKHTLAVVETLAAQKKVWDRMLEDSGSNLSGLSWIPYTPLDGDGDWLARVQLDGQCMFQNGSRPTSSAERLTAVRKLRTRLKRQSSNLEREPALAQLLDKEVERLKPVATPLSSATVNRALKTLRCRLYPYQKVGLRRFLDGGRLLLADDMGLGKTAQAIAAGHVLFETKRVRRGLLIVPASLKFQWEREWHRFSDVPITIVSGSPETRKSLYEKTNKGFLIANYEQVLRDLAWMRTFRPELIILDEAQRIKNWATKTAQHIKQLETPYRLVLTGTPLENRLEELASLMDWVDDRSLEPKWRLPAFHVVHNEKGQTEGLKNLDILRARLAPVMLRRRRTEVLSQLPPRTDSVIPVELTPAQRFEHDALREPIAKILRRASRRPLTHKEFLTLMSLLTTQRIIANGLAQLEFESIRPTMAAVPLPELPLLRSLDSPKLLEFRELVDRLVVDQGRKLVVFSQWRRMLELAYWAVSAQLSRAGYHAAFFSGREGQRRRAENVAAFHDDAKLRILFATDAGGVGLNLQKAANVCVNLDLPWNPAVLEQRVGRVYRMGQKQSVNVVNLIAESSIESRIAQLVGNKQALFSGLFDGDSNEVAFDENGGFLNKLSQIAQDPDDPRPRTNSSLEATHSHDPSDLDDGELEEHAAFEGELNELINKTDESRDAEALPDSRAPTTDTPGGSSEPSSQSIAQLFQQVEVRTGSNGNLLIEAPPAAAQSLAALLQGFGQLLQQSGTDRPQSVEP